MRTHEKLFAVGAAVFVVSPIFSYLIFLPWFVAALFWLAAYVGALSGLRPGDRRSVVGMVLCAVPLGAPLGGVAQLVVFATDDRVIVTSAAAFGVAVMAVVPLAWSGRRLALIALAPVGAAVLASWLLAPTALIDAARAERLLLVRLMLLGGADVHQRNDVGLTPVILAADGATVARLLAAGANPNDVDNGGATAMSSAARRGDLATLDLLLSQGARIDAHAMRAALYQEDRRVLDWMRAHQAPLAFEGALEIIASRGDVALLREALAADGQAPRWNALMTAFNTGRRDLAELLLTPELCQSEAVRERLVEAPFLGVCD